jgi:putative peptidoglycan lipid II flippase
MQLPVGLFGVAVATVSLPRLSDEVSRQQMDAVRSTFSYSMRLVFALTIPVSVLTAVMARPLCSLLYERGSFSSVDTLFTSQALVFYSLAIFGAGSSRVLASTFYSLKRPKIPMKASFLAVGVNILLNLTLMWSLRFRAMALSASLASVLNMALLFGALRSALGPYDGKSIASTAFRVSVASGLAGAAAWVIYKSLIGDAGPALLLLRAVHVAVPSAAALLVFLGVSRLLKIDEVWQLIRDLSHRLRRS